MTTPLDTFETSLLDELRRHVETRSQRHTRTRRVRVVTAMGAVAAATTALLVLPGLGPEPVYSVQRGNAGEVDVTVNRFEDAAGLESALRHAGIAAEVTYVGHGGQCVHPGVSVVDRPGIDLSLGADRFRVDLAPGTIRPGETLVIDASLVRLPDEPEVDGVSTDHGVRVWVNAQIVRGPVPACVPTAG